MWVVLLQSHPSALLHVLIPADLHRESSDMRPHEMIEVDPDIDNQDQEREAESTEEDLPGEDNRQFPELKGDYLGTLYSHLGLHYLTGYPARISSYPFLVSLSSTGI